MHAPLFAGLNERHAINHLNIIISTCGILAVLQGVLAVNHAKSSPPAHTHLQAPAGLHAQHPKDHACQACSCCQRRAANRATAAMQRRGGRCRDSRRSGTSQAREGYPRCRWCLNLHCSQHRRSNAQAGPAIARTAAAAAAAAARARWKEAAAARRSDSSCSTCTGTTDSSSRE